MPTNLLVEPMVIELRPGGQVMSNLCATPLQCWNQTEECVVQPIVKEFYISYRPTRIVTKSCVRLYNEEQALTTTTVRAVEMEHGDFTPLVLSELGVRGPRLLWPSKTIKFMSQKYGQSYGSILYYISCWIIFSLIHSSVAHLKVPDYPSMLLPKRST